MFQMHVLARVLGEVVSPTRCVLCERPGSVLCPRCEASLACIDPAEACDRCGAPFGRLLCTECAPDMPVHGRCLAACVFAGAAARIVRTYKDGGERALAAPIAAVLARALCEAEHVAPDRFGGIISTCDVIAFVPATAAAFRRRGFDHMEGVASELSAIVSVPVCDALAKHGATDQRSAGRAGRRRQAEGAYEVVMPVRGLRLLLIDDVITTGATVRAAASELVRAGASRVDITAFARVWG